MSPNPPNRLGTPSRPLAALLIRQSERCKATSSNSRPSATGRLSQATGPTSCGLRVRRQVLMRTGRRTGLAPAAKALPCHGARGKLTLSPTPTLATVMQRATSKGGRPKTPADVRRLICQMSVANPLWRAPRIHGELLKLGIDVGQTTWRNICRRAGSEIKTRPAQGGLRRILAGSCYGRAVRCR